MPQRPTSHRPPRPLKSRDNRPSAHARGYTKDWQRASRAFLRTYPLCYHCGMLGRTTPAEVVDHIRPHKGDPVFFWDESNWQSLCKRCHDAKTAAFDGGFGRPCRES